MKNLATKEGKAAAPSQLPPLSKRGGLHEICRPGLILHLLFPDVRRRKGRTFERAEYAAQTGFYRAVEIAEVEDRDERAKLRRLVEENDLKLVYWLSFLQMESVVSISSPEEEERRRAVGELLRQLPHAAECRAHTVAIVSGRDVGVARRGQALESLKRSVFELAEAARPYGLGRFEMETMDREVHKKHVLGPTAEALAFIHEVRQEVPGFYLAFDTAHIRLLGEDPAESLAQAAGVTGQIHLANCVDDPRKPGFGDHHIPPGPPGFLDRREIRRLLDRGLAAGVLGPKRPIVSVEVAGDGGEGAFALERATRAMMEDLSREMGARP
ncbi:MAG: TIM barrel protein [Verrucomicrobiia bacterium]